MAHKASIYGPGDLRRGTHSHTSKLRLCPIKPHSRSPRARENSSHVGKIFVMRLARSKRH
eukprot:scaffold210882_cov35-Tisochrysis_lutea.AAC.3